MRNLAAVRIVVFDVGETLVDETRAWGDLADRAGVTRLTLFAALGSVIERGEHHREVWRTIGVARPPGGAQIGPEDLYPDVVSCLEALDAEGVKIGMAGNQPEGARECLVKLGLPVAFIASGHVP